MDDGPCRHAAQALVVVDLRGWQGLHHVTASCPEGPRRSGPSGKNSREGGRDEERDGERGRECVCVCVCVIVRVGVCYLWLWEPPLTTLWLKVESWAMRGPTLLCHPASQHEPSSTPKSQYGNPL